MKKIGILGGLGPQATMDLEARIHKEAQCCLPQDFNHGYPPMVVYYFRETAMVLDNDGNVPDVLEPHPGLLEAAKHLGCITDFLIIASNTPHFFVPQIQEAAGKPVLSIVDVVLEEVKRRAAEKVGVLAFGPTLRHRLYQSRLDELGIPWEAIPDELSSEIDASIYALMEGSTDTRIGAPVAKAVGYLQDKRADVIILGCTELPLLYGSRVDHRPMLINPAALLAQAAIGYAIEK